MFTFEKHIYEVPAVPDPDFVPQSQTASSTGLLEYLMRDRPPARGAPLDPNLSRLEFAYLDVQDFIDGYAVHDGPTGALNMELTAAKIGIPLTFGIVENGRALASLAGLGGIVAGRRSK